MGAKAFENPLLGHARMRAMYRALVETRLLAKHLGAGGLPLHLEACWVGTAIDLRPGDLTSDRRGGALLEHIRGAGLRRGSGALKRSDLRRTLHYPVEPFDGSELDRLLCAVGAAMATRSAGRHGVVMAFAAQNDLSGKDWKRLLRLAAAGSLPLIVVAVPAAAAQGPTLNLTKLAQEASSRRIPVIPVDASDAVALYRVAQESLVRARAEGGTMIVDCIAGGADPVELLGAQLVKKRICTSRWLADAFATTADLVAASLAAEPAATVRKRNRSNLREPGRVH